MLDIETLQFRASVMQKLRTFLSERGYLELDTPAMSPALIPETCLEVFEAAYIDPWTDEKKSVYLVPSPEVFMKKIIKATKTHVFQISKCYRNIESTGRIHSPEFTMLEYYTMNAGYMDSLSLTEELFTYLLPPVPETGDDPFATLRPPFIRLRMDDAFQQYALFRLSDCPKASQLAEKARGLGIAEFPDNPFDQWPWDDLYELLLVQCVEPALPKDKPVFLMDYPVQQACLAKDVVPENGGPILWKERWELYAQGTELANCYSEETDPRKVKAYFEKEGKIKNAVARVRHTIDSDYWKTFEDFPECSGVAMGVDRLIMLLAQRKSIEAVIPFPFRLKTGYY